jgi:hypothetical protein
MDWRLKPKFDAGKEERSYSPNLAGAFAEIGADQHALHGAQLFESVLAEQQKYLDVLGMSKPAGFQYPVHRHFLTFRPTASQMQDGFTLNLYLSVAMVDQNDTTGFDVVVDQATVLGQ